MILSRHDSDRSFSTRFGKSSELDQMAVQIDPLDIIQFCVVQEAGQVVSHGANAIMFGSHCKRGIFIEEVHLLNAKWS
jgi:hypothetical protein